MHAMNVMNSITSIVDTLDNPESLVDDLKQIGLNHRKRPIEAIHFHVSIYAATEGVQHVLSEMIQSNIDDSAKYLRPVDGSQCDSVTS